MGKWSEKEEAMKPQIRSEIIAAMWEQIARQPGLSQEKRVQKFATLKGFLGIKGAEAARLDLAVRQDNFELFKLVFTKIPFELLADIEKYEYLAIKKVDKVDPVVSQEDIDDLKEYMKEKGISASVVITNRNTTYHVSSDNIVVPSPIFSIHSIGKVFTGILAIKMIHEGIIPEAALDEPVQLDKSVLSQLSIDVQKRLQTTTLKQLMMHESGLGDYLPGQAQAAEEALNKGEKPPKIDQSRDLLKYADKSVFTSGEYHYSNLGILLVGFALEKAHNDYYKFEGDNQESIDKLMQNFVRTEIKMDLFETHMPKNGRFNRTEQRFNDKTVQRDQEYLYQFVASRFGSPAGGQCTTAEDLQKLGAWIFLQTRKYPEFKRLIETHGGEFYRANKEAISHSGLHADSAHFYTSLRNGTIISVLSDQGGLTATNLLNTILKQTTWFKEPTLRDAHSSKEQQQPTQSVSPIVFQYDVNFEQARQASSSILPSLSREEPSKPKQK